MFLILLLGDGGASRKWSSHARSEKRNSGATHCAGVCLPAASKRWRHEQAGAKLASIESARSTASFAPRRTARGETMHQDSAGGGEDVGEGVAQEDRMPRNRPQLSGSAAFLRGGLSSSGCFRACRSCAPTKSAPNKKWHFKM